MNGESISKISRDIGESLCTENGIFLERTVRAPPFSLRIEVSFPHVRDSNARRLQLDPG